MDTRSGQRGVGMGMKRSVRLPGSRSSLPRDTTSTCMDVVAPRVPGGRRCPQRHAPSCTRNDEDEQPGARGASGAAQLAGVAGRQAGPGSRLRGAHLHPFERVCQPLVRRRAVVEQLQRRVGEPQLQALLLAGAQHGRQHGQALGGEARDEDVAQALGRAHRRQLAGKVDIEDSGGDVDQGLVAAAGALQGLWLWLCAGGAGRAGGCVGGHVLRSQLRSGAPACYVRAQLPCSSARGCASTRHGMRPS